jgi:hypothetical protein
MTLLEKAEKICKRAIKSKNVNLLFEKESRRIFARLSAGDLTICKNRLKEAFGAKLNLNDFHATITGARSKQRELPESDVPAIIINRGQLPETTSLAIEALAKANNPPFIFEREGSLVG